MFPGMDHVFQAVQLLVGRNAMLDGRFYEAAGEFVTALRQSDQWPGDLREKAVDIQRRLTAGGNIEATIQAMDLSAAEAIAEDILDLTDAIAAISVRRRDMEDNDEEEILDPTAVRFHHEHLREGRRRKRRGRQLRACRG